MLSGEDRFNLNTKMCALTMCLFFHEDSAFELTYSDNILSKTHVFSVLQLVWQQCFGVNGSERSVVYDPRSLGVRESKENKESLGLTHKSFQQDDKQNIIKKSVRYHRGLN